MKKYLLSFAVMMMGMALFTACGDDDDVIPEKKTVNVSEGLFIVGSGNTRSNIDGNLTYIDFASGTSTLEAFKKANGISLGKTANFILIYGQKLYIVVDGENTIWVCNKSTLAQQRRINTVELIGTEDGISPRSIVAYDGKIFVSCYGNGAKGTVAAIDTLEYKLQTKFHTGSYSDGITVAGSKVYVANSDYGYGNASITVYDTTTGQTQEIRNEHVTNPMHMVTVGNDVYFLDYGTYDENWVQSGAGVRRIASDGTVKRIMDGTTMATDGKRIFTAYAPYGSTETLYYIYNISTGQTTTWSPEGVFSPAAIAADPVTGDIFVVSYNPNPDTGKLAYNLPSFVCQYSSDGTFKQRYDCGVGPISTVFNTGVKYE